MRRRPERISERLLRRVVRDDGAYQGLLGDLHEELRRTRGAPASGGPPTTRGGRGIEISWWRYDLLVLWLARSYVWERLRARRRSRRDTRSDGLAAGGRRGTRPKPGGRGRGAVAGVVDDVRLAARFVRRRPRYAASVIGTLGLGFGAAAVVLSVAYGVWLRPLPFARADDLVRLYEVKLDADNEGLSRLSPPLLEDLRATDWTSLTDVAAVALFHYEWTQEDENRRVLAISASRGVFDVLGLEPLAGRFFSQEAGTREVVLGESLWQRAFGGTGDIFGAVTMTLDGESYLIVGAVRDGLPYPQTEAEMWTPFDPSPDQLSEGMRGARYLDVVGRLRPATPLVAARDELDGYVRGLGAEHPNHDGWGATVVSLRADLARPFATTLRLFLVAVALFLLIACVNVAGLVATRRVRGGAERGVRRALGASRARMLRQDVAEMLLLGGIAALLAAVVATWSMAPLRRLAPVDLPRLVEMRIDATVIAVVAGLVIMASVVVAVIVSALGGRTVADRSNGHGTTPRTGPLSALLVAQVALTTVLLLGGAALANHFRILAALDPGFDPEGVAAAVVLLSEREYPDAANRLQFYEQLVDGLKQRGHAAAIGVNPPLSGGSMPFGYRAGDGGAADPEEQRWAQYHIVSPDYFSLLGIPVRAGRSFDATDRSGSTPVVIINEALARQHFAGNPIGHDMTVVGTTRRIVGVVGSTAHLGPDQGPTAEMYVPLSQDPWSFGHVLIRPGIGYGPGDAREVAAAIDPGVAVPVLSRYEDHVRAWFAPLRFQLAVVSLLAAAGATLALVGLYALIAFVVAGRRREIGIRVALGETARAVFMGVLGRGLALTMTGIVVGSVTALWLRGIVESLGAGIETSRPLLLPVVGVLVLIAAGAAAAGPARRAAAVDPVETLRRP